MNGNTVLISLAGFLALAVGLGGAQVPAPTPSFTISPRNITMAASGNGSIPFTFTSVNGFAGPIVVTCMAPNSPAGVTQPFCENPVVNQPSGYVITPNGRVTGGITILASAPNPLPVMLKLPGLGGGVSLALAGGLMLGFGFRRRRARWSALLLAVAMLIGLTGIGACGSSPTLTPGTYTYTLSASDQNDISITASTTVKVTVPPGITTQ